LTDQGIKLRANDDLKDLIRERTKAYNEIKKRISQNRDERYIREADDDGSTDSEDEKTKRVAKLR